MSSSAFIPSSGPAIGWSRGSAVKRTAALHNKTGEKEVEEEEEEEEGWLGGTRGCACET